MNGRKLRWRNLVGTKPGMGRVLWSAVGIGLLGILVQGCGQQGPSYRDRIGTVDPATAPIDSPPPPGT